MKLRSLSGNPVFVKKVSPSDGAILRRRGFSAVASYPWHPEAACEDDEFPEVIVGVGAVRRQLGSKSGVGDKVRRAERRWGDDFVLHDFTAQRREDALTVLQEFFALLRKRGRTISKITDYLNMLAYPPLGTSGQEYVGEIGYVKNSPAAIWFGERLASGAFGIYANIVLRAHYPYLSYLLHERIFGGLEERGVIDVNLGGSEYPGLHDFKRRLDPGYRELPMEWCVLL